MLSKGEKQAKIDSLSPVPPNTFPITINIFPSLIEYRISNLLPYVHFPQQTEKPKGRSYPFSPSSKRQDQVYLRALSDMFHNDVFPGVFGNNELPPCWMLYHNACAGPPQSITIVFADINKLLSPGKLSSVRVCQIAAGRTMRSTPFTLTFIARVNCGRK